MTIAPDPHLVRGLVLETFELLGEDFVALSQLDETIVLDAGRYVARSYRTDNLLAMWLVEIGVLQFYDAHGNMLRTMNLLDEREEQRLAA